MKPCATVYTIQANALVEIKAHRPRKGDALKIVRSTLVLRRLEVVGHGKTVSSWVRQIETRVGDTAATRNLVGVVSIDC